MGDEISPAVWGMLGTLIGAAVSIGTSWLSNGHASKLETQKSRDLRLEGARAFQRETLVGLQDAIHILVRKVTEVYLNDVRIFHETQKWGEAPLNEELSQAAGDAFRNVAILTQRVSNGVLRENILEFVELTTRVHSAVDMEEAKAGRSYLAKDFEALALNIGNELRSHYEPLLPSQSGL